jgi:REP element-mobilizing transposase RayT
MARPLRLEFADALYHVTSRGNERRPIFRTIRDRQQFLLFLGIAVKRFGWSLTAWVLMTSHDHLVMQTPEPNLSKGMHWLNSRYGARQVGSHLRTSVVPDHFRASCSAGLTYGLGPNDNTRPCEEATRRRIDAFATT